MIVAHYRTGALYRVLFETEGDGTCTCGPVLLSAIIATNDDAREGTLIEVHLQRSQNAEDGPCARLVVHRDYAGVVYIALADGKIFFRRKSQFYETVNASAYSRVLDKCIRPAPPARVPRFKEVKL